MLDGKFRIVNSNLNVQDGSKVYLVLDFRQSVATTRVGMVGLKILSSLKSVAEYLERLHS